MRDYRQDFGRLLKLGRAIFESEDSTEESEENKETKVPTRVNPKLKPMPVYWDTDKQDLVNRNQQWIDLYLNDDSLRRIPDTTEEPVKESHYKLPKISWDYLPDHIKNLDPSGVTESPKPGTGISSSGRDAGMVTGIVVAVISGVLILGALIAVLVYRHYVHRNVTSMNFDNPVYRKTTEDQFALEKNGYAPGGKLYPSTVGEEAQEPLNTIGTNDFV